MTDRKHFFVCGAPKSGTTWLQRLLDEHPQIQCSGEGHFVESFSVPLAQVMRSYQQKMRLVSDRVYEGAPYYPPVGQEHLDRIVRGFINEQLMSRQPGPEVRWIGDKTPRYAKTLPALLRLFPEARIVNIVRDPRDVAMARMHQARRAGIWEKLTASPAEFMKFIADGGADWANSVELVERFADEHPGVVRTVRYEDLIRDTGKEARGLFRFLDVDDDDALIARIVEATSFERQSGRKRGEELATSFLRKGVVGDWIGRLERDALAVLDDACGNLMRAHGYV